MEPPEDEGAENFRRGLAGQKLKPLINAGGAGRLKALDDSCPETARQRGRLHKMSTS